MPYLVLLFLTAQFTHANSSPIIITEIGAHEISDVEWVEIYNQSELAVDMTDWKFFEDGSKHGLKSSQGDLIIEPKEYAVIANVPAKFIEQHLDFAGTIIDSSWSSLKESGELISLIDNTGNHMDEFTYSTVTNTSLQRVIPDVENGIQWMAHATSDSVGKETEIAPQIDDPVPPELTTALELEEASVIPELENESVPLEIAPQVDVTVPLEPSLIETPKNIKTTLSSISSGSTNVQSKVKSKVKKIILPTLLLSEIYPNPYGSDSIYEFFEIENVSDISQSLKGWQLKTNKQSYNFDDINIEPHSFFQITRDINGLAFDNYKENIQLLDPSGKVIDKYKYSDDVPENASYIRHENSWKLSIVPTRGSQNIYVPINAPPEVTAKCFKSSNDQTLLVCDASDTTDVDHDQLNFRWNMRGKDDQVIYYWDGDYFEEPYETFKSATMELIISDAKHKIIKSISIPRRGETIVNIQSVRMTVPQNSAEGVEKKKASKKPAVKKKAATKKAVAAKTYDTTVYGIVVLAPDKNRKKMTIEYPGMIVSSPRGRLPDVKIGDEVSVTGRLNPTTQQITISVAEDVSVIFHHAPPQPITVTNLEELKRYNYALVSVAGEAQDIYDTGFNIVNENLQLPVYLPPTLRTSPDRFEEQKIVVTGIIKQYRNAPEIVPRSIDDIKIVSLPTPEIGHKTVNQFINVWRDWRVGTTLAIAALMTLLSWRIRRLVPAAVRVDATAEDKDRLNILKSRAVGGRPPSIMLE